MKHLWDPIYGSIDVSPAEIKVIDSAAFQRLRHVHQLGLSNFVFHGAEHSRFGHSVGVLHTVTRAFDTISAENSDRLRWTTAEIPRYRILIRLAGLLHDVGHAPFSHAAENAIAGGLTHEDVGRAILLETDLGDVVDEAYRGAGVTRTDVLDLWSGALPPNAQFLRDLVSSNLDCDRMDYLLRDSHYAGVSYGKFDQARLIGSLTVTEDEDGSWALAVHEGGLYALESLILARYFMFLQVYFHKVRRAMDLLLGRYVESIGGYPADTSEYLALDDNTMWVKLRESEHDAAKLLVARRPYKEVFKSNPLATEKERTAYLMVVPDLEREFGDQVIFDDASTNTHKFELPYGAQSASSTALNVVTERAIRPFHELSQVVANLPREVNWLRIFASRDVYDDVTRKWEEAWSRVTRA